MTRTEDFLNEYKKLEMAIEKTYGDGIGVVDIETCHQGCKSNCTSDCNKGWYKYREYKEHFGYCRRVRNFLAHNKKIDDKYAIEVSKEMIDFVKKMSRIALGGKLARNVGKRSNEIIFKTRLDKVLKTLREMKEQSCSHVPIVNEKKVLIGVFSENTLFSYLLENKNEMVQIDKGLRFCDIEEYLAVNGRPSETFVFVKKDEPVENIIKLFDETLNKKIRIGAVFVTSTGKADESITHIITVQDMAVYGLVE